MNLSRRYIINGLMGCKRAISPSLQSLRILEASDIDNERTESNAKIKVVVNLKCYESNSP